jgi:hypothetical protein
MYKEGVIAYAKTGMGAKYPDTSIAVTDLAKRLSEQGGYVGAGVLQRKVLTLHYRILGMEHPHTNISAWNGSSILLTLGKEEEAR